MAPLGRIRKAAVTALVVGGLVATATGATAQDLDCDDFRFQEDAQAALDAEPDDPLRLDANGDGVACETLPRRSGTSSSAAPTSIDLAPPSSSGATASPAPALPTTVGEGTYEVGRDVLAGLYRTPGGTGECFWVRLSDNTGGSSSVIAVDGGRGPRSVTVLASDAFVRFTGDCRWTRDEVVATTSSAAATSTAGQPAADDRDCPDFPTQAQAQAALTADPTDPDDLDTDGDGIACEELFGTQGQQVAVVPVGGVATGGRPAP